MLLTRTTLLLAALAVLTSPAAATEDGTAALRSQRDANKRYNVLFIVVDDLRPQIGPYNVTPFHPTTPALDGLASKSTVFKRAYCQQAVCSPSRNSFNWGRYPKTTKIWNFKSSTRENSPEAVTLPQYMKDTAKYVTTGMGKIFHPGHPPKDDQPYSWTTPSDGGWDYFDPDHQIEICNHGDVKPIACALADNKTVDFILANSSVSRLGELSSNPKDQPFFMGLGHLKPHPFVAVPQYSFDQYPLESITMPKYPTYVSNLKKNPEPSFYACGSMGKRTPIAGANLTIQPYTPLPENITKTIRQAYWAGTTHTDKQIGKTLDRLEALGLMEDTIISFHADHGWGLGEQGEYCKQSETEHKARVPMMIYMPWDKTHRVVEEPVEIVSMMNTLIELATGSPPAPDVNDGVSYAPFLLGKDSKPAPPRGFSENLAFSVYPRCFNSPDPVSNPCTGVPNSQFSHMGLSVRSQNYRYTEWRKWDGSKCKPRFDVPAVETLLFNHTLDNADSFDGDFEQYDFADDPAYASVRATHAQWVDEMWNQGWASDGCGKDLPFTGTAE